MNSLHLVVGLCNEINVAEIDLFPIFQQMHGFRSQFIYVPDVYWPYTESSDASY